MKFKKNFKKGFTLVELIVVIAIVAILAAVSVVSYVAFIKQANESADIQLVKQLNIALQADEALNGTRPTMYDMLGSMEENGFVVENLTKTKSGYDIVWDQEHNRFGLLDNETLVYGEKTFDITKNKYNYWKFADTEAEASNQLYSVYLTEEFKKANVTTLNIKAGLDTGVYAGLSTVNYSNVNSDLSLVKEQNVVIRTSSQATDVIVNAPKDEVSHYGVAKIITIQAVKMGTYNEYGCVATIALQKGKVEIKNDSIVGKLDLSQAVNDSHEAAVVNDGTVFTVDQGGNTEIHVTPKSSSDVIEIGSADALINIASAQNQGLITGALNLELKSNIDLTGRAWTPFGNSHDAKSNDNKAFNGIIDGNGFKITGLSDDRYIAGKGFSIVASGDSDAKPFGLITYAEGNVTIRNLTIEAEVSGNWTGASAFISCYDSTLNNDNHDVIFDGCKAQGTISAKEKVGGFIGTSYISGNGRAPKVTFNSCVNEAYIKGTDTLHCRIGGFVGTLQADNEMNTYPSFTDCVNSGEIQGIKTNTNGEFVGCTGSGGTQTISFERCSANSNHFLGCFDYSSVGEKVTNPTTNTNVTITLTK